MQGKRILYLMLGWFSLITGIIGIFLPLLPTTPLVYWPLGAFLTHQIDSTLGYLSTNFLALLFEIGSLLTAFQNTPETAPFYSCGRSWRSPFLSCLAFGPPSD